MQLGMGRREEEDQVLQGFVLVGGRQRNRCNAERVPGEQLFRIRNPRWQLASVKYICTCKVAFRESG